VRVPVRAARDVLTVHTDAGVEQGGCFVYIVDEGKAVRKRVLLGESAGGRFIVREGLDAGMLAVTRGNERLRPGQPVTTGDKPTSDKAGEGKPACAQGQGS